MKVELNPRVRRERVNTMIRILLILGPMMLMALCLNAGAQTKPPPANECLQTCKSENKSCIQSSNNKLDECMATEDEIPCMLANKKRMDACKALEKACTQKCSHPAK